MRFVKLTILCFVSMNEPESEVEIRVNVDKILSIQTDPKNKSMILLEAYPTSLMTVKESPENVIQKIMESANI